MQKKLVEMTRPRGGNENWDITTNAKTQKKGKKKKSIATTRQKTLEEAKRKITPQKMQLSICSRDGKSKQREMETKSTKRLEEIIYRRQRKV